MYVIKVNTGDELLTYTFQNTSSGKSGDDTVGIGLFSTAFRNMYKNSRLPVTMTIMNENGLYFSPTANKHVHTEDKKEITIYLSDVK